MICIHKLNSSWIPYARGRRVIKKHRTKKYKLLSQISSHIKAHTFIYKEHDHCSLVIIHCWDEVHSPPIVFQHIHCRNKWLFLTSITCTKRWYKVLFTQFFNSFCYEHVMWMIPSLLPELVSISHHAFTYFIPVWLHAKQLIHTELMHKKTADFATNHHV